MSIDHPASCFSHARAIMKACTVASSRILVIAIEVVQSGLSEFRRVRGSTCGGVSEGGMLSQHTHAAYIRVHIVPRFTDVKINMVYVRLGRSVDHHSRFIPHLAHLIHLRDSPTAVTPAELAGKAARERYICPLTKKAISNVNPATVLRPSGMVVSSQCVKDFIKKDMRDPFTDPPAALKDKDIIPLRIEGTGFAARTEERALKVTKTETGGGGGW